MCCSSSRLSNTRTAPHIISGAIQYPLASAIATQRACRELSAVWRVFLAMALDAVHGEDRLGTVLATRKGMHPSLHLPFLVLSCAPVIHIHISRSSTSPFPAHTPPCLISVCLLAPTRITGCGSLLSSGVPGPDAREPSGLVLFVGHTGRAHGVEQRAALPDGVES